MKCFYIFDGDNSDYKITIALANSNIHVYQETIFSIYANRRKTVYSIEDDDKACFETYLKEKDISFTEIDLRQEYKDFLSNKKPVLDDSFLGSVEVNIFKKIEIPQIIECINGAQLLTEETIKRKDKIKIYTHSGHESNHNIPHVHFDYNGDKNYCSISLLDYKVLAPDGFDSAKIRKCRELLTECIDEARLAWNEVDNHIKFRIDSNGKPINEIYSVK